MKIKPGKHTGKVVLELNRGDERLMAESCSTRIKPLFQLKRILVPTDFSDCALKALQYAIPLAREHGAVITLLYVVEPLYVASEAAVVDTALLQADRRATGEKDISTLVMNQVEGKVPCDTLVRNGSPGVEIIETAKKISADLIVISTHGFTGLKHVFLGSVAEQVVRRAPCPVLVVREHEHEFIAA